MPLTSRTAGARSDDTCTLCASGIAVTNPRIVAAVTELPIWLLKGARGARPFLGLLLGVLLSAGCVGEQHFQSAWKTLIIRSNSAIQKYTAIHGRLPERIEEAHHERFPQGEEGLVQFQKKTESTYVLWIHREDIERLASQRSNFEPTEAEPKVGDVFGEFDLQGRLLSGSWNKEALP